MFLLQLPRWGVTPCNAIWATCNDLCRESLAKLATDAPELVVGRIYKEIDARSGKIALQVSGGVLHCATAVASCYDCCEKYRTGFYFVQRCSQRKKDALQVAEVPCYTARFFSNLQRNGVALQVAVKMRSVKRTKRSTVKAVPQPEFKHWNHKEHGCANIFPKGTLFKMLFFIEITYPF